MMPIKCVYIDDNDANIVESYWKSIEKSAPGQFEFVCQKPKEFGQQIESIKNEQPTLLILELRLDKSFNEKGQAVPYHGPALAQELRIQMIEGEIASLPIVLWSLESQLRKSYYSYYAAHNLFDRVYSKDKEITNEPARVALELQALVEGYQQIANASGEFHKMLGLETDEDIRLLHPNIGEPFIDSQNTYPVHEYARYLLRELIDTQGPLINEAVLAARLGVDRQNSSDWEPCKAFLAEACAYTGAFHQAWPRWWAFQLEEWWRSKAGQSASLRRLKAKERVEFLRATTGLQHLQSPPSPIEVGYDERYWTVCQGFDKPVDPVDAFRISCPDQKPWQEPPYLSIKAALQRVGREKGLKIAPLEYDRLNDIRERMEA